LVYTLLTQACKTQEVTTLRNLSPRNPVFSIHNQQKKFCTLQRKLIKFRNIRSTAAGVLSRDKDKDKVAGA
jgi:Flp pilus assembly CpaF family ATPase